MSAEHPPLNALLIQQICLNIKGGAFEQTACEAQGVPLEIFQDWLTKAQQKNAGSIFRMLLQQVRQARAQARLKLEFDMHNKSPRQWLLHGPGKETPDCPGWSAPARPGGKDGAADDAISPRLHEMIMAIVAALKPFPDARLALEMVVAPYFKEEDPASAKE